MSIRPESNYSDFKTIENMLQTDSALLNQVKNSLASQSFFKKMPYCLPSQYKQAQLLKAAQILFEKDQKDYMTISQGIICSSLGRHLYSQVHPIQGEPDPILKALTNTVNCCLREIPKCENKIWFKNHELNIAALIKATNANQPVAIQYRLVQRSSLN